MKETFLKALCFLAGLSIVIGAGACGQNTTAYRSHALLNHLQGEAHVGGPEVPPPGDGNQDQEPVTPPGDNPAQQNPVTPPGNGGQPSNPSNGGGDQPSNPPVVNPPANGGGDQPGNSPGQQNPVTPPGNGGGQPVTPPGNGGTDQPVTPPGNGGQPSNPSNGGGDQPGNNPGQQNPVTPPSNGGGQPTNPPVVNPPANGGSQDGITYRPGACTRVFPAQPLSQQELDSLDRTKLPYVSTMSSHRGRDYRHLLPVLNLGERYDTHHDLVLESVPNAPHYKMSQHTPRLASLPAVKDAQIVFKIQLRNLPPRNLLEGWEVGADKDYARLRMPVTKVSQEGDLNTARLYMKTELLCFMGLGWCSGEVFSDHQWLDNINPALFPHGTKPENEVFTSYKVEDFLTHGSQMIFYGQLDMELEDLLRKKDGSLRSDVLDVIYGDTPSNEPLVSKDLYFVVADDTFVSNWTQLDLRFRVKQPFSLPADDTDRTYYSGECLSSSQPSTAPALTQIGSTEPLAPFAGAGH